MTGELTHTKRLAIISKAWGKQDGYCFFPWIDGKAKDRKERINGYHEGRAFKWPEEKAAILEHMAAHEDDDLYWCPSLFEKKRRVIDLAMDEHALWADLDEVDPREIPGEYRPTIAWESSPGRYQALWLVSGGDIQGASWPGGENQRLTYYLGADVGGWDTTQLLRIPGWNNHKPAYREGNGGHPVPGRLLWDTGRRYLPDEFTDLPEVATATGIAQDIVEAEIEKVDRHEVWGRVRLKVTKRVRELVAAREVAGDRSDVLWEIERELADAGCTVPEIVAVVRATVWNKFEGRNDELKRLITEASKAMDQRSEETVEQIEEDAEPKPEPVRLTQLLANVKPPKWLIRDIWAEMSCGFIAGQPKSFKSWTGFDMALSVATGMDFLGYFKVVNPGPVLMIQEEDPPPTLKDRFEKIWPGKLTDRMVMHPDGHVEWIPKLEAVKDPDVMAYVGERFTVSDPGWQAWLDEQLAQGMNGEPYRMVLMDPLMMIAGEVDEHRAQEMTERVFKPLKQLSRKHGVAMVMVHHMRKGDPKNEVRGGQKMLGSVANHAWTEDALYMTVKGREILVEHESKHSPSGTFRIGRIRNREWVPSITGVDLGVDIEEPREVVQPHRGPSSDGPAKLTGTRGDTPRVVEELRVRGGGHTASALARMIDMSTSGTSKQLRRAAERNLVKKIGAQWFAV